MSSGGVGAALAERARALGGEAAWLAPSFAVVAAVFLPRILAGEAPIGGDIPNFTLPQLDLMERVYSSGSLPGWSPFMGTGLPLIGDSSLPLYYPFSALLLVMNSLTYLAFFLVLHLLIAQVGIYALARSLNLKRPGAGLAAAAFGAGGFALCQVWTPMYIGGLAWVPWVCYGALRVSRGDFCLRGALAAAAPLLLIVLSGAVELAPLSLASAAALALGRGDRLKVLIPRLAAMTAAVLALTALIWLPSAAVVAETARARGLPFHRAAQWSLHPYELLGLAVPRAFAPGGIPAASLGAIVDRVWYKSLYFGALPLVCLGYEALKDPRSRRTLWYGAAVCAVLALACGEFSPVYRALYDWLPPLRSSRYPAKLLLPAALLAAIAAGAGFDRALAARERAGLHRLWLGLLIALGAVIAAGLIYRLPGLRDRALLPLGAAALSWAWFTLAPARLRGAGALAILGVELAAAGIGLVSFGPRAPLETKPLLLAPIQAEQSRGVVRVTRTLRAANTRITLPGPPLPKAYGAALSYHEMLYPNCNLRYRVRSSYSFSPLRSKRWEDLFAPTHRPGFSEVQAARIFGASHLICSAQEDPRVMSEVTPVARSGGWLLARIREAPPWASIYRGARLLDSAEAARDVILSPAYRPGAMALVERDPVSGEAPALPPGAPGPVGAVRLMSLEADRIELEVESEAGGLAVIREAYAPGWTAALVGPENAERPLTIFPADGQFRGVVVPAGRHRIRMEYDPPGWRLGLALSLISASGLALALLIDRRRR